ncbi:hypothetical protein ACOSQ4_007059 [Xanthoceras sorbifolium]
MAQLRDNLIELTTRSVGKRVWLWIPTSLKWVQIMKSGTTQEGGNGGGKSSTQIAKEVPATVDGEANDGKGQGVGQSREAPDQSDTLKLTNIESTTSLEGEIATLDNLGKAIVCHVGRDSREEKEPLNNHGKGNKALCVAGKGKRVVDKATKRTVGEMVIRTEAMTKRDTTILSTRRRGKHGSRSPARRILYNKISPSVSLEVGSKRKGEGISTDDRFFAGREASLGPPEDQSGFFGG